MKILPTVSTIPHSPALRAHFTTNAIDQKYSYISYFKMFKTLDKVVLRSFVPHASGKEFGVALVSSLTKKNMFVGLKGT